MDLVLAIRQATLCASSSGVLSKHFESKMKTCPGGALCNPPLPATCSPPSRSRLPKCSMNGSITISDISVKSRNSIARMRFILLGDLHEVVESAAVSDPPEDLRLARRGPQYGTLYSRQDCHLCDEAKAAI